MRRKRRWRGKEGDFNAGGGGGGGGDGKRIVRRRIE